MIESAGIVVREVLGRDGFQSWPEFVPTGQKIELVDAVIAAGVRQMETTSFASPQAIPQLTDGAEVIASVSRTTCRHTAMVPNLKGAERAVAAGVDAIIVVISVSEPHNQANTRRSVAAAVADLDPIFATAAAHDVEVHGALATSFGCPYQGEVPEADVFRLAEAFITRGTSLIMLADTTGMAVPPDVVRLASGFRRRFPDVQVGLHLHNNRGTAMANLVAAIDAGVRIFDTALGGIGGCPNVPKAAGNLPTEDVVYLLEEMGYPTGIDLMALIAAARRLEQVLGKTLPGQVMKSGPRDPELAARVCATDH